MEDTTTPADPTPAPEPDLDGPIMGTAQLKVTLRGDLIDRPTLDRLADVVSGAIEFELGIPNRVRGEWT